MGADRAKAARPTMKGEPVSSRASHPRVTRSIQRATLTQSPEWICHACRSFEVGWEHVDGRGRIYSWERVWHPVHPALRDTGPYVVVLVELPQAGGVRMIGNLVGDPHQEVVIGAPVTAVFEQHAAVVPPYALVHWTLA